MFSLANLSHYRKTIVLSVVEEWAQRDPDEFRRLVAVSPELARQVEPIVAPIIVLRP